MLVREKILSLCRNSVLLGALVAGVSGCDSKSDDNKADPSGEETADVSQKPGYTSSSAYLPFRIAFKRDGTIVILDEKGNEDIWDAAKFPLETKSLYRVESTTFAFVQGSCTVIVLTSNNTAVKKTYPSAVCKYLGIPEN